MKTTNHPLRRVLPVLLLLGAAGSCASIKELWEMEHMEYPAAHFENLERLHTPSGKHHYTVRFRGDVEHALGQNASIRGFRFGAPSSSRADRPTQLSNPSETCMKLLDDLLDRDSARNPRLEAMQVAWCSRIIETDPSVLSRERAVRALSLIGTRRGAREPYRLRVDAPRSGAEDIAVLLDNLNASWKAAREGGGSTEAWKDSMAAIEQASFDLGGYRRILPVVADLLEGLQADDPMLESLTAFLQELEVTTICFAFGQALSEKTFGGSVVRGAAVRALGEAGGEVAIARLMPYLRAEHESGQERDPYMVSALLSKVAELGFPAEIPGLDPGEYLNIQENWYSLMVSIAVTDPDSGLRVKACQALAKVTGQPSTLREEEWEDWLYARVNARAMTGGQASPASAAPKSEASPDSATNPADSADGGS